MSAGSRQEAVERPTTSVTRGNPDRVVIISDLHIGAGRQPDGQVDRLEHFHDDAEFEHLVDRLRRRAVRRGQRAELVLNGDVFDFVRTVRLPAGPAEVAEWRALLEESDVAAPAGALEAAEAGRFSRLQRRYGYDCAEHTSVWKLWLMSRGHPRFMAALARWCAAGLGLVVIRGNHDSEWAWPGARRALRVLLRRAGSGTLVPGQLRFRLHAYRRANLWIEHGNSIRWSTRTADLFTRGRSRRLMVPVGSLINRFVLNPLERLLDRTPNLPSSLRLKRLAATEPWRLSRRILANSVRALPAFAAASWRAWYNRAKDWLPARIGWLVASLVLILPLISNRIAGTLALGSGYARAGAAALAIAGPQLGLALVEVVAAVRDGTQLQARKYAVEQAAERSRRCGAGEPLVVLGHTHAPELRRIEGDNGAVVYANPGCWIESPDGEPAPRFVWCALQDGRYGHATVFELAGEELKCRTHLRI